MGIDLYSDFKQIKMLEIFMFFFCSTKFEVLFINFFTFMVSWSSLVFFHATGKNSQKLSLKLAKFYSKNEVFPRENEWYCQMRNSRDKE